MSELLVNTIKKADGTGSLSVPAESGTVVTTASPSLGRRNLIINGAMQVAQRGTSTAITTGGYASLDRFQYALGSSATGRATISQSSDAPSGFGSSYKVEITTADAAPSAAYEYSLKQRIEGQNLQALKKGTADAESVTVSFWVKCSITGTFIVELMDNDNSNRHINKSYTVDSANTWEYKTITFSGDTTGALDNDNANSMHLLFWNGSGSNFTGGALQTSWGTLTQTNRAVGQTNLFATIGNTWQITGVQLEVGSVASSYEHRSYGEELALCQRYYQVIASDSGDAFAMGTVWSNNAPYGILNFLPMRANPTLDQTSGTDYYRLRTDGNTIYINSFGIADYGNKAALIYTASSQTGGTRGASGWFDVSNANGFIALQSEL